MKSNRTLILNTLLIVIFYSCTPENPTPNPTIVIPTITTTAVSSIYNNIASSGGKVISDGYGPISAWGVCWSTSANPTLSNSFTTAHIALLTVGQTYDNEIFGGFSSLLSGLTQNTTYYVRAYAINSAGTAYGNEQSFTTANNALLTIGQSYEGGKIAYIDASGIHGLIAATSDIDDGTVCRWGCYGTLISGADGTAIGSGNQNTIDIINGCNEATPAQRCEYLVSGGYSDWYLPSKDELNQLYINRVAIGGFANSEYNAYWSSTEYDQIKAFFQNMSLGNQNAGIKDNFFKTRAVRSF